MVPQAVLALSLLAAPLPPADSVLEARLPPPSVLAELRRRHRPGHWLRVTTVDARLDLRARVIDEDGLGGLSTRSGELPASDAIAWAAIERIDRLHSRRLRGQITGGLLGAIVGPALGGWIGTNIRKRDGFWDTPTERIEVYDNYSQLGMLTGLVVGTVAGTWLGGRRGERQVEERTLYVAAPSSAPVSSAARQETAPAPRAGAADTLAGPGAPPATAPPAAARAAPMPLPREYRRVRAERMLRVTGDFGRYQGTASAVTPEGLVNLRPDVGRGPMPALPALVTWDRIDRITTPGTSAARGAMAGGTALGLAAGVAGMAIVAALGGTDSEVMGGLLLGAGIGGGVGIALGGLVGAAVPRWHVVYERP